MLFRSEPFAGGVAPTAENLARIIFEELAPNEAFGQDGSDAKLVAVTVWESPKSSVTYTENE